MASGRAGLTSPGLRLPYNPNLAVAPTAFLLQGPRHLLGPTSASTRRPVTLSQLPFVERVNGVANARPTLDRKSTRLNSSH